MDPAHTPRDRRAAEQDAAVAGQRFRGPPHSKQAIAEGHDKILDHPGGRLLRSSLKGLRHKHW
jgi:hypothetical protein